MIARFSGNTLTTRPPLSCKNFKLLNYQKSLETVSDNKKLLNRQTLKLTRNNNFDTVTQKFVLIIIMLCPYRKNT